MVPGRENGHLPTRKIGGKALEETPDFFSTESRRETGEKERERERIGNLCAAIHKPRFNFKARATRERNSLAALVYFPRNIPQCDEARFARRMKRKRRVRNRKIPTKVSWIKGRIAESWADFRATFRGEIPAKEENYSPNGSETKLQPIFVFTFFRHFCLSVSSFSTSHTKTASGFEPFTFDSFIYFLFFFQSPSLLWGLRVRFTVISILHR